MASLCRWSPIQALTLPDWANVRAGLSPVAVLVLKSFHQKTTPSRSLRSLRFFALSVFPLPSLHELLRLLYFCHFIEAARHLLRMLIQ